MSFTSSLHTRVKYVGSIDNAYEKLVQMSGMTQLAQGYTVLPSRQRVNSDICPLCVATWCFLYLSIGLPSTTIVSSSFPHSCK